jgi:hypothetical protein
VVGDFIEKPVFILQQAFGPFDPYALLIDQTVPADIQGDIFTLERS